MSPTPKMYSVRRIPLIPAHHSHVHREPARGLPLRRLPARPIRAYLQCDAHPGAPDLRRLPGKAAHASRPADSVRSAAQPRAAAAQGGARHRGADPAAPAHTGQHCGRPAGSVWRPTTKEIVIELAQAADAQRRRVRLLTQLARKLCTYKLGSYILQYQPIVDSICCYNTYIYWKNIVPRLNLFCVSVRNVSVFVSSYTYIFLCTFVSHLFKKKKNNTNSVPYTLFTI